MKYEQIHFVGIGGVGMAGLAHLSLDLGASVSGSDIAVSGMTRALANRGVEIIIGHRKNLPTGTQLLVYSSAVPVTDPERMAAEAQGIPQIRRGDFLSKVIAPRFQWRIAVSGSHGKSSTAAMITHLLAKAGLKPGYMIGAQPADRIPNAASGNGAILVSEVDESDGSQAEFPADIAVVLNIDDDHSWAVGGTAKLEESFVRLASHAKNVIAWDAPVTRRLFPKGTLLDRPAACALQGLHNRQNGAVALETVNLLRKLAALPCPVFTPNMLEDYKGIERRLSLRFNEGKIAVIEDYAHHPTELKATLDTLREVWPGRKIHILFQPHRLERVQRYGDAFAAILSQCDWSGILPPFGAWRTDNAMVDEKSLLADKITAPCHSLPMDFETIAEAAIHALPQEAPVVLAIVGAGDITKTVPFILQKLNQNHL